MRRLYSFIALAVPAGIAAGQYSNIATATALGEPDVVDATSAPGIVQASNSHDTGGNDNPAFGASSAAGRPSLLRVASSAGAESFGPSSRGSASARLRSTNDLISFAATEPFIIEVSIDLVRDLQTDLPGDDARVIYSADFRRLSNGGIVAIADRFRYTEVLNQGVSTVSQDDRDPFAVQMLPGDVLDFRLAEAVASATAIGSNGSPPGLAFAELNVEIGIAVIAGDAQLVGASSGGDYAAESCVADLAAPFGTLNFFDIAAYIALYNAGDAQADVAAPFGSLNFFDISAYVGLYNTGCP